MVVEDPIPNENNQTDKEPEVLEITPQDPMELQPTKMPDAMDSSGTKRLHTSDNFDFDKDNPRLDGDNPLALVSTMLSQGEWRKVEKKK